MLDIELFRKHPEIIKESEKKRFKDPSVVDKVIEYDNLWRETLQKVEKLKHERNEANKKIVELKKEGKDASEIIEKMRKISKEIDELEEKAKEYLRIRDEYRYKVGNILHESVPVGGEDDFEVVRTWGEIPKFDFEPLGHADLVEKLDIADLDKAAEVSGARFYYLKNEGVLLNLALIRFAMDKLRSKGYKLLWTPYMLRKKYMKGASELADFEETLYKVEGEDLFLIATAEQTLASFHAGEILDADKLPIKYAGFSTNFRREAGSHGKDTKGIFRVHQFDKVEQFVFCKPEESWKIHEEITAVAEEIFRDLGIPYRIINIASGDMNDNAAKKYDLEGWFPAQNKYRELVSSSNVTDFQARKLNIKTIINGEKVYVHTLNSTAIATERAICAILENYQQKDGSVKIPPVLVPYMNGITEIKPKK